MRRMLAILLWFLIFGGCEQVYAPKNTSINESYMPNSRDSYVTIYAANRIGSGSFVNQSGLIMTASHVVTGLLPSSPIYVTVWYAPKYKVQAALIADDIDNDIALLQIEHRSKPIPPMCDNVPIDNLVRVYTHNIDGHYISIDGAVSDVVGSTIHSSNVVDYGMSGSPLIMYDGVDTCTAGLLRAKREPANTALSTKIDVSKVVMQVLSTQAKDFI